MLKKYILLTIFSFIFIGQIVAQSTYEVKAKVINKQGELPSGNVIALNPVDSSFINGDFFLDGELIIALNQNSVLLKITSIEFSDYYLSVEYAGEALIDLGEIVVNDQSTSLGTVLVTGKRPQYIRKGNGTLEVIVENTMLSASSNVFDVLSRTPELVVDDTGEFSVMGRGEPVYYLNGKRIVSEQLTLITPANIKSIQIIRNPPAKYDAEGAAVVEITTITKTADGYQIKLSQNLSYSNFGGFLSLSNVNLNLKKGRFLVNSFYSNQLGEERELLQTTRDRAPADGFLTTDLSNDYYREFDNFSNYGLGLQYDINANSYFSAEYSGKYEQLGGDRLSMNEIADIEELSFFETSIGLDQNDINHTASVNYNTSLDTLGSSFFIGGQYSHFDISTNNPIEEEETNDMNQSIRFIQNNQGLDINILSGQIDYLKYLNKSLYIEAGAKYSTLVNDFNAEFLVSNDNMNFSIDENFSNTFNYDEEVAAAYISLSNQHSDKVSYSIGLRAENTDYSLTDSRLENPVEDNFLQFFPNASFSYTPNDEKSFSLSYVSRIGRAPYSWLNPVLIYQDPFTGVQGNPLLVPQISHVVELNSRLFSLNFLVGYNYTRRPLDQSALRGNDEKSYVLTRLNHDRKDEFYFSMSKTLEFGNLTSQNTFYLTSTYLKNEQIDYVEVGTRPNIYYYSNNSMKLSNSWKAELLFWYVGVRKDGLFDANEMFNVTLALEKTMLDGDLSCRLIANDIFHGIIASGDYFVNQTDIYYNRRWSTDYVRLALNYNFGRLTKANYKNKNVGSSETGRVD
ncbi:MAG: outer membrane beta-barrel protein [Bacteroidota bacterium]